jgi:hypothetical protein
MKLEDKLKELKEKGLEVFAYPDNIQNALLVEISTKGVPELAHAFNVDAFFREVLTKGFDDYILVGFTKVQLYLTFHKLKEGIE